MRLSMCHFLLVGVYFRKGQCYHKCRKKPVAAHHAVRPTALPQTGAVESVFRMCAIAAANGKDDGMEEALCIWMDWTNWIRRSCDC